MTTPSYRATHVEYPSSSSPFALHGVRAVIELDGGRFMVWPDTYKKRNVEDLTQIQPERYSDVLAPVQSDFFLTPGQVPVVLCAFDLSIAQEIFESALKTLGEDAVRNAYALSPEADLVFGQDLWSTHTVFVATTQESFQALRAEVTDRLLSSLTMPYTEALLLCSWVPAAVRLARGQLSYGADSEEYQDLVADYEIFEPVPADELAAEVDKLKERWG